MRRRKVRITILLIFAVLLFYVAINMETTDTGLEKEIPMDKQDILATSDDFKEVYELNQEILKDLQRFCLSRQLSEYPKEVDYEKVVKVYVGTDILRMDTNDKEEMLEALESNEYVWLVSINTAAGNYQITIARDLALSNDKKEQQEIYDAGGKWVIQSHSLAAVEPYLEQIEEKASELPDCARIVLVGEQPGFYMPVAIGFDESKAKYLIGLGFQYGVAFGNSSNTSVYEFDKIAERVKKTYRTDSTETQWGPLHFGAGKLLPAVKRQQTEQPDKDVEQ